LKWFLYYYVKKRLIAYKEKSLTLHIVDNVKGNQLLYRSCSLTVQYVGGANILISGKEWRGGGTVVSILLLHSDIVY
jgi:hypothetical protein